MKTRSELLRTAVFWMSVNGASIFVGVFSWFFAPVRWWEFSIVAFNAALFCYWLWERGRILSEKVCTKCGQVLSDEYAEYECDCERAE